MSDATHSSSETSPSALASSSPQPDFAEQAHAIASAAQRSARVLRAAPTARKDAVLRHVASRLREPSVRTAIKQANALDLEAGTHLSAALRDRLMLDDKRLDSLVKALEEVAALPDPVGRIERLAPQASGIEVGQMMVPLGVILMAYESRPNVTLDTAALCLKAGNAVILRGGKEAAHSNAALAAVMEEALEAEGLPAAAAQLVRTKDRELLYALLQQVGSIDLAIPRGGTGLIDAVNAHAKIPVIQHYQGICHVYVHQAADVEVAERIVVNAKTHRPGVCNAMEGVVVDAAIAETAVPRLTKALQDAGVEVRGCDRATALAQMSTAAAEDFDTEFLDLICTLKVVDGVDDALSFIADHGSGHSEAIITTDHSVGMRFLREVDASCVLLNASTRFNDGGQLGLGAELGISTTKLHAYGPMGLEQLCTKKFIVLGHGETRA